jgi:transcription elongation factor Elf1
MVYYDPICTAPRRPPPICPKCGNHRTQIVGLADDGGTLIVRCNACGERSEVKIEADTAPADFVPPPIDSPSL